MNQRAGQRVTSRLQFITFPRVCVKASHSARHINKLEHDLLITATINNLNNLRMNKRAIIQTNHFSKDLHLPHIMDRLWLEKHYTN